MSGKFTVVSMAHIACITKVKLSEKSDHCLTLKIKAVRAFEKSVNLSDMA